MRLLFFTFLIVFSINLFSFSLSGQNLDTNKLDEYIKRSKDQWNIPGLAIAIVKDGEIIFSKGYGVREFGKPDKVDDESLFAIASNTKAFTASALSILVDEKKIDWDDPVQKYLPYFKLYDPYVSANMTIRDLLCHRSGLKTFSGDLLWYGSNYSRKEVISRAQFLKPVYGFRSHYGYSNIMFLTAGEIIPAITGQSWDEFLAERFFKPLEMVNTNTSIKDFKKNGNIAMPHHVGFDENPLVIPYVNWDNIGPAGAINSNVKEMTNWLIMNLNNGVYKEKQILSEENIRQMRTVQTPQFISKWSETTFPTKHYSGYGLGWELFDYHGRKIVNHGGGADGMISKVVLVPEEKFGFVILTNSINYLPSALSYYILDSYFGKEENDWSSLYFGFYKDGAKREKTAKEKKEKARLKNTSPSLPLNAYVGNYVSKLYGEAKVELKNDKLMLFFIPTPIFVGELTHYQINTFGIRLKNQPGLPEGNVNFTIGQTGKVEKMLVDIPNPDFDFTELDFIKVNE
ncbi:MAG: serine hydrolase [Bacteroidales bacterium]|nr:serine hydrolase [Bacteroidales bacterium]